MTKIDRMLWLLLDGKWHTLNNLSEALQTDIAKLEKIATFLQEFNFIEFNPPRVRITPETKKFLKEIRSLNREAALQN